MNPQRKSKRLIPGWALALAAAFLAYVAYRLFVRYGAGGSTEAETVVYGMLLFILGIAAGAFVLVALLKLAVRLIGRRRISILDKDRD